MTTDEPTSELRCSCGYLLQGLTEKRCPECGRPFPGKPRRRTREPAVRTVSFIGAAPYDAAHL